MSFVRSCSKVESIVVGRKERKTRAMDSQTVFAQLHESLERCQYLNSVPGITDPLWSHDQCLVSKQGAPVLSWRPHDIYGQGSRSCSNEHKNCSWLRRCSFSQLVRFLPRLLLLLELLRGRGGGSSTSVEFPFSWLWRHSCQSCTLRLPVSGCDALFTGGCVSMGWQGCRRVVFWRDAFVSDAKPLFVSEFSNAHLWVLCVLSSITQKHLCTFVTDIWSFIWSVVWCWGSARHHKIWLYWFVMICSVATLAWNLGRLSNTILWVNLVVSSKSLELISWKR